MNRFSFIRFSFFVAAASLVACAAPREGEKMTLVSPEGERIEIQVEIADNPRERAQGLMFRESLEPDAGMLFVYAEPDGRSMWMKNTYIPLDILFIRNDGTVSSVARHTEPLSLRSISSVEPVTLVLELNAGTTDRLKIGPGNQVYWFNVP